MLSFILFIIDLANLCAKAWICCSPNLCFACIFSLFVWGNGPQGIKPSLLCNSYCCCSKGLICQALKKQAWFHVMIITKKPLRMGPEVEFLDWMQLVMLLARTKLRGSRPDVMGMTGYTVYPTSAVQVWAASSSFHQSFLIWLTWAEVGTPIDIELLFLHIGLRRKLFDPGVRLQRSPIIQSIGQKSWFKAKIG